MNLYRNGQFVETFRKSREHDILTNYLAAHAEPHNPPAPASTSSSMLLRFSPPVPVPLPVRARLAGT